MSQATHKSSKKTAERKTSGRKSATAGSSTPSERKKKIRSTSAVRTRKTDSPKKTRLSAVPTETPVITQLPLLEDIQPIIAEIPGTSEPPGSGYPNPELPDFPTEPMIVPDEHIEHITTGISSLDTPAATNDSAPAPNLIMDGGFEISRQVLARIASLAAGEIEGVSPVKSNPLRKIVDRIHGRTNGIRVDIGTTEAAVDMHVRVQYGTHIPRTTSLLRETVARRINEMTGLKVVEVNVRVQDVTLPNPSQT